MPLRSQTMHIYPLILLVLIYNLGHSHLLLYILHFNHLAGAGNKPFNLNIFYLKIMFSYVSIFYHLVKNYIDVK